MTLWTIKPDQDHDVYTVVYLLKDALRSALSDAWYFERTALHKADLKGAGHAEIAAKLGRFRDSCKGFEEREALMVTKLCAPGTGPRNSGLEPEFQPDIDTLPRCDWALRGNPVRVPAGRSAHIQRRHVARPVPPRGSRRRRRKAAGGQPAVAPTSLAARKALYELRAACEEFLAEIDSEFFSRSRWRKRPRPCLIWTRSRSLCC